MVRRARWEDIVEDDENYGSSELRSLLDSCRCGIGFIPLGYLHMRADGIEYGVLMVLSHQADCKVQ